MKNKTKKKLLSSIKYSTPYRALTCDFGIRSAMFYTAELREHQKILIKPNKLNTYDAKKENVKNICKYLI